MNIFPGSIMMNFLNSSTQQFRIPVYQRNYEWSYEQCDKLFTDIVNAGKNHTQHFCGSIVYQSIGSVKGINNSIIIDGQQRLTTIYILLKALYDCADISIEKTSIEDCLFNKDPFKILNLDETTKMKLKPAKEDNNQLLALIYDKKDTIKQESGIYRNYEHFCKLIKKEIEKETTISTIQHGISMLIVAVVQLDSNDNAQEIFERINSTGIELKLADKIRNFVLMTDVKQDELYDKYWLKAEKLLNIIPNKDQMSSFFLDYLNMKLDGNIKESEAYDRFKQLFTEKNYTHESMLQEILHYAKQYYVFKNGDLNIEDEYLKIGKKSNNALLGLRKLNQTTVYLFLFKVFDDKKEGYLNNDELSKILDFLLSYLIRRSICEINSNSLRGFFKTLHARVFNDIENKNNYYDSIVSFMMQLNTNDAIPDDDEFKIALMENNLYRKNALCNYLLISLENQGKEHLDTEKLTIEHILPQNKNISDSWKNMLGENYQEIKDRYLHTLGNLSLTGYNSELSDKSFENKKKELSNSVSHVTYLNEDVLNQEVWNQSTIEKRANRLANKLIQLYPIIEPKNKIQFNDTRYRMYKVTDPNNATYKSVNYYELEGERVIVDSFSQMLKSVVARLYEEDPSIIEYMASKNEPFPGWSIPVFSFNKNQLKSPIEIKEGCGVYMNTGYSARDIIYYIKATLIKYGKNIDEDFVYSARTVKGEEKENKSGPIKEAFHEFWEHALFQIKQNGLFLNSTPPANGYLIGSSGISGVSINCVSNYYKANNCRVEIYINTRNKEENKALFDKLYSKKQEIENILGCNTHWDRNNDGVMSKVFVMLNNKGIEDKSQWESIISFNSEYAKKFYEIVMCYLK